ncbi:MAG: helix-turn-helix domain-containing protein [Acholeplasmatales bacterium]|nr:helix-turn-helix domain-containing protein [Acholeplasmatales bacterium]
MEQKEIGERIRFLRVNKLNISQEDFACKIGLDRTYISKVESGQKNLTLETLNRICRGLSVTLKEFFDFDGGSIK